LSLVAVVAVVHKPTVQPKRRVQVAQTLFLVLSGRQPAVVAVGATKMSPVLRVVPAVVAEAM
jgi:hypothetical protein